MKKKALAKKIPDWFKSQQVDRKREGVPPPRDKDKYQDEVRKNLSAALAARKSK